MKIIGGPDKDKEDEARKRADALAKAISKMLPQHLSHGELLAALSSVLAAAFAEDGTREDVIKEMRDLTALVLAESARSSGDSAWDSATFQKRTAMIRRNEGLSHANAKGEAASPPRGKTIAIEPAAALALRT
jgi:hypothetical protein